VRPGVYEPPEKSPVIPYSRAAEKKPSANIANTSALALAAMLDTRNTRLAP